MRDKPNKQPGNFLSKAKKAFAVGSLFTALIAADPSSAQTIAQKNDFPAGQTTAFNDKDPTAIDKTTTVSVVPNAFTFAATNVDKYFPDMKEHLATMMNSFRDQEHKDSTLALLNKMTANIDDPEQKTGAVIYALEGIFNKSTFAEKYDSKITDQTFKQIEIFDTEYKARSKRNYARLVAKAEQLKQELKNSKETLQNSKEALQNSKEKLQNSTKEFEKTMDKFSPQDIKKIPGMKEWIILDIQKMYEDKENNLSISPHMQSLFDAAK